MTTPNIINIAKVCVYLVIKAIQIGREKDTLLAQKLAYAMLTVEDIYDSDPTDEDLTFAANGLYAMCGGYAFEAQNILNTSSGGIIVNPSTGTATLQSESIFFVVGDPDALISDGETSFTIDIGAGSILLSGLFTLDINQTPIPNTSNNNYRNFQLSYAAGIITVTLNQAAVNSEAFEINYAYLISS